MISLRVLFTNFQKSEVSNDDYLKEFQARVATLDDYNAIILDLIPCLLKDEVKEKYIKDIKSENEMELKAAKESVKKKTSAALLLIATDYGRYGEVRNHFHQSKAMGTNNYPRSINETMNVLNIFAKPSKGMNTRKLNYKTDDTEVAFTQGKDLAELTCYNCGKRSLCKDEP